MLTIFIFFIFYNLDCTASTSPSSPINVTFSSVNLRNVLHWFPGNGTHTDETLFTVEYAIYGDTIQGNKGKRMNWRAVQHCRKIARTWCDLSSETWDMEDSYYAKVRAVDRGESSKWALTRRRFDPKIDTTFGPPLVSVETENNNATITMKGPMRHPPNNQTPALSMAAFYPQMKYNLSVHNTHKNQMYHFLMDNSVYKFEWMEHNTNYCFSAQSRFLSMPIQCQSSAWLCIITPQDPRIKQLESVVVGIVVPALCICMISVAGYLLHHYLSGKDQKSPNILFPPPFYKSPFTFPPENLNLIPISSIGPELPGNIYPIPVPACPRYILQVAGPPPSYSPQRHEASSEPEEPSDDSFVDYGGISMAPQITVGREEEVRGERRDDEEPRVQSGHSAGAYAPQTNSSCTCGQTPMQIQTRGHTEMNTHVRAHAWPPASLGLWKQKQLLSFPGSAMSVVNKKKGDRETPSEVVSLQLNLQTKEEVEQGEELDEEMMLSVERPLISAYASQNVTNMSASHSDQSKTLLNDYGVIRVAARKEEKEERGTLWVPKNRKLVLPKMEFNHERWVDEPLLSERGIREEEEEYVTRGRLRLEDVFVRQASEEEAAQKESENDGEMGSKVEDIFNKWDLKIPMDQ
ncbi:interleukin-20 receptor subunit alpha [Archocentrus centrarchus]|uniref:interleukin-20 receptor subunit alpha n=1 Tax=Archocentrus centrarchus TaxID=63155 RepID=UPI0011E9EBDD|nr:uncharacterized protein LOC115774511 [Archocentrus centrarchus]